MGFFGAVAGELEIGDFGSYEWSILFISVVTAVGKRIDSQEDETEPTDEQEYAKREDNPDSNQDDFKRVAVWLGAW